MMGFVNMRFCGWDPNLEVVVMKVFMEVGCSFHHVGFDSHRQR
jgi:hypothetical protein